mmetsp:Transcript_12117/g.44950  ORF Transcript_12117/g.44950 Transcript_12117/m.44950 type:complete len:438 (-) Transcript_12117:1119-2432(-)
MLDLEVFRVRARCPRANPLYGGKAFLDGPALIQHLPNVRQDERPLFIRHPLQGMQDGLMGPLPEQRAQVHVHDVGLRGPVALPNAFQHVLDQVKVVQVLRVCACENGREGDRGGLWAALRMHLERVAQGLLRSTVLGDNAKEGVPIACRHVAGVCVPHVPQEAREQGLVADHADRGEGRTERPFRQHALVLSLDLVQELLDFLSAATFRQGHDRGAGKRRTPRAGSFAHRQLQNNRRLVVLARPRSGPPSPARLPVPQVLRSVAFRCRLLSAPVDAFQFESLPEGFFVAAEPRQETSLSQKAKDELRVLQPTRGADGGSQSGRCPLVGVKEVCNQGACYFLLLRGACYVQHENVRSLGHVGAVAPLLHHVEDARCLLQVVLLHVRPNDALEHLVVVAVAFAYHHLENLAYARVRGPAPEHAVIRAPRVLGSPPYMDG